MDLRVQQIMAYVVFNQDETVNTEDLLYLLATFGRDAPTGVCNAESTNVPNPAEVQMTREYLYCSLRDTFRTAVEQIEEQAATTVDAVNATCADQLEDAENAFMNMSLVLYSAEGERQECATALATQQTNAAADIEALEDQLAATQAYYEQRLNELHCPVSQTSDTEHTNMPTSMAVGSTTIISCNAGYTAGDAYNLAPASMECTSSGQLVVTNDPPTCVSLNPCETE
jgi:hypothetical protein